MSKIWSEQELHLQYVTRASKFILCDSFDDILKSRYVVMVCEVCYKHRDMRLDAFMKSRKRIFCQSCCTDTSAFGFEWTVERFWQQWYKHKNRRFYSVNFCENITSAKSQVDISHSICQKSFAISIDKVFLSEDFCPFCFKSYDYLDGKIFLRNEVILDQDKPGVYAIINLRNYKLYLGSTVSYKDRRIGHFSSLRNNAHHTTYLQNSFNKYGEENFVMKIVEECSIDELGTIEQDWITKFSNSDNLYNSILWVMRK